MYERKHLSITDLTARSQNNSSCVLGMRMSDSDNFLMAESSIWWVVLSDSNNALRAWELLMGFQVWITGMDNTPGTNSEVHDYAPQAIFFTLAICKDTYYSPWRFSTISKKLWALVSVFASNISVPWVLISLAGVSPAFKFIAKSILLYIESILFRLPIVFD